MLCFTDLETCGSTPDVDYVLEIGTVLTDDDLNEIDTFQIVVRPPDGLRLNEVDPVVLEMHSANGLWREAARVETNVSDADGRFADWLLEYDHADDGIRLAGSGVSHFDHDVIRRRLPRSWGLFAGYNRHVKPTIDVGVVRRLLTTTGLGDAVPALAKDPIPHRALADARRFVLEAQAYHNLVREALVKRAHDGRA